MKNVKRFLEIADELESSYPYLYVEIARTRGKRYIALLEEKPGEKEICMGQGETADDACADAIEAIDKSKYGLGVSYPAYAEEVHCFDSGSVDIYTRYSLESGIYSKTAIKRNESYSCDDDFEIEREQSDSPIIDLAIGGELSNCSKSFDAALVELLALTK